MNEGSREFESYSNTDPLDLGYLVGLVDGEGCVYVRYDKSGDSTGPFLRIYCTSKPIVDNACRIMHGNPSPCRDHGRVLGWNAVVQGRKAVEIMRLMAPYMTDPSKKCRALTILKIFDDRVSIKVGILQRKSSLPVRPL